MKKSYITHIISYSLLTIVTSTIGMDLSDDLPKATVYIQHGNNYVDLTGQSITLDPQDRHGYCYFGNEGKKHFIQPTIHSANNHIGAGKPIQIEPLTPTELQTITNQQFFARAVISVSDKNFLLKSFTEKSIQKPVFGLKKYNALATAFYQEQSSEDMYQILSGNKTSCLQANNLTKQKLPSGTILGYFDQTCYIKVNKKNTHKVIALPMESDIYKSLATTVTEDKSTYVQYNKDLEQDQVDTTTILITKAPEQQDTDNQALMPISCNIHKPISSSVSSTTVYQATAKVVYDENKKEVIKLTFNVAGVKYTRFAEYYFGHGFSTQLFIKIDDIHQGAHVQFTTPSNKKELLPLMHRIFNKNKAKQLETTNSPFVKNMRKHFDVKKDGTLVITRWNDHRQDPELFLPTYDGAISQAGSNCVVTIQQDQEIVKLVLQKAHTSAIFNGKKLAYLELTGKHSAAVCIVKVEEGRKLKEKKETIDPTQQTKTFPARGTSMFGDFLWYLKKFNPQKGHYVAGGFAALFAGALAYWYYTTE